MMVWVSRRDGPLSGRRSALGSRRGAALLAISASLIPTGIDVQERQLHQVGEHHDQRGVREVGSGAHVVAYAAVAIAPAHQHEL